MNEMIAIQEFEGQKIRTHLDENGDPWFVATDICEVLDIKNQRHALRKLDDDMRRGVRLPGEDGIREFAGVSEAGLYILVMQSGKPKAKKFTRWITTEVLPSIRKTGSYSIKELSPAEQLLASAQRLVDQERRIKDMAQKVREVEVIARQDNDTLTHDQISELDALINKKYKEIGDIKVVGYIRKKIKMTFFDIAGSRTYKEIPRHAFEAAKEIVNRYGTGH